jgi:hypothetical protein
MEGASLAISICAFALAASGFGWTIYEWRGSGARLKVRAASRVEVFKKQSSWDFGSDTDLIAIETTNTGRTATTVHTLGLAHSGGEKAAFTFGRSSELRSGSSPLPARLEPGETLSILLYPPHLLIDCEELGCDYLRLEPFAICGHGRFTGTWSDEALELMQNAEADEA